MLESLPYAPHAIEVVAPGMNTTVQDWPGRTGYWHIGLPPSGPMDSLSFRLATALVGNEPNAAGLEVILAGALIPQRAERGALPYSVHCYVMHLQEVLQVYVRRP